MPRLRPLVAACATLALGGAPAWASSPAAAPTPAAPAVFRLHEAGVAELLLALDSGVLSSVELAVLYANRQLAYDRHGPRLHSTPVLNPDFFAEAAAADARRARGESASLLGIPYTVKDSYKVRGLTVASGSPAFAGLIANEDAFVVERLRAAGAIVLGKTNMPPMAAGGMQPGVYGRAESPTILSTSPPRAAAAPPTARASPPPRTSPRSAWARRPSPPAARPPPTIAS